MKTHKNILIAFLLNLLFSIIEFIGGIITNSVAIISDSIHDFGDAITIAISWVLERKSKQKPNAKYTFGYTRYSVLGAFITSTVLLIGSIIVI
jgi:cobalt-zinc-cadmium efflux system protein